MYTISSQAAAMAASLANSTAGGLSTVTGLHHHHQQQLGGLTQQYQYNHLQGPLSASSAFDLRRMFAAHVE